MLKFHVLLPLVTGCGLFSLYCTGSAGTNGAVEGAGSAVFVGGGGLGGDNV